MKRHLLAIVSLLTLLLCVGWSGTALILVFVAHCHVLYAVGQLIIAIPGLVLAARAGLAGVGAAAAGDINQSPRWRALAIALAAFAVWVLFVSLLAGGSSCT